MKKLSNKGFTLVELIIVIAILAIIMLIAIPNFSGIQQRMQVRADKSTAAQIGKAVRVWFTDFTTDSTMIGADATEASVLPAVTAIDDDTDSDGLPVVDEGKVTPTSYENLYKVEEYISKGQKPSSLRNAGAKTTDTAQFYGVFLTADATDTAAKIAVAIAGTVTEVEVSVLNGKTQANYDGSTAAVAYIEP